MPAATQPVAPPPGLEGLSGKRSNHASKPWQPEAEMSPMASVMPLLSTVPVSPSSTMKQQIAQVEKVATNDIETTSADEKVDVSSAPDTSCIRVTRGQMLRLREVAGCERKLSTSGLVASDISME